MRNHWKLTWSNKSAPQKGKDNPFQRQRVCFKHTHIFFRQWKSTFCWRVLWSDAALPIWCSGSLALLLTVEHVHNEIHLMEREKHKYCRVSSLNRTRAKQRCPLTSVLTRSVFSASCVHISLIFVAFVVSVSCHSWNFFFFFLISGPIENMCNIHTISPLNCTQKIKMLLWKWKFRKVQIKKKRCKRMMSTEDDIP